MTHHEGSVAAVAKAAGDGVVLIRRCLDGKPLTGGVVCQPGPAAAEDPERALGEVLLEDGEVGEGLLNGACDRGRQRCVIGSVGLSGGRL